MAMEWLAIGSAIARLLLRASDMPDAADALTDTNEGWQALRTFRRGHAEDSIARAIEQRLSERLAGVKDPEHRGDLNAAASDVAQLIREIATSDAALLAAAREPEKFYRFALEHGGRRRRELTSERATPLFDQVLAAAADEYARLAPSSPRFAPLALLEALDKLDSLPGIGEDARRAAEGIEEVKAQLAQLSIRWRPPDEGTVAACLAATRAGEIQGAPIAGWNPSDLEVHTSITTDGEAPAGLVPYVERDHDWDLRAHLSRMVEPASRPLLIIVVGTSCVGKTRSLYEGISAVLPDWPVIRPARNTSQLAKLLRAGVPSGTIVWLDELKDYVNSSRWGLAAASDIRELLADPTSPAILFAATTWQSDLAALGRRPDETAMRDGYGAVIDLLQGGSAQVIHVPDRFDGQAVSLGERIDARLQEAFATARKGEVAQVLGGGALLINRYRDEDLSSKARAIVDATADVRRIGHPGTVPDWLLRRVAHLYLPKSDYPTVSASWIQEGIDEASERVRGIQALSPAAADEPGRPTHFELHDYLLQTLLAERFYCAFAPGLWRELAHGGLPDSVPLDIRNKLADSAEARGLYRIALRLSEIGSTVRDDECLARSLDMRARLGDRSALDMLRRELRGNKSAYRRFFHLLVFVGDDAALAELRDRAKAKNNAAQRRLIDLLLLRALSGDNAAGEGLRKIGALPNVYAVRRVADLIAFRGRPTNANELVEVSRSIGDPEQSQRISLLWLEHDAPAVVRTRRDARLGRQYAQRRWAERLAMYGGPERAHATHRVGTLGGLASPTSRRRTARVARGLIRHRDAAACGACRLRECCPDARHFAQSGQYRGWGGSTGRVCETNDCR